MHLRTPDSAINASRELLEQATAVTPGGVNTARRKIDPPLCCRAARGAYLTDVDGNRYIDFHAAYGGVFLGHSWPRVTERVRHVLDDRVLFGVGTTELELEVATKLVEHIPSAEQIAFCGSGSEATLHAVRLARAVTAREKLIKFRGCTTASTTTCSATC